jgi:ribosomal protein S18 acetylase RimI-like enzyme
MQTITENLSYRKAVFSDLRSILDLYIQDELGGSREQLSQDLNSRYIDAFDLIDKDPNQFLMVVILGTEIVGTCHLTIMPSLTLVGSTRMQVEAVRVAEKYRGQKIGEWMLQIVIQYAKSRDASIIQLTTNKSRPRAKKFYESIGFDASHEGMKLYLDKT